MVSNFSPRRSYIGIRNISELVKVQKRFLRCNLSSSSYPIRPTFQILYIRQNDSLAVTNKIVINWVLRD